MRSDIQVVIDIYKVFRDYCAKRGKPRHYLNSLIYRLYVFINHEDFLDNEITRYVLKKGLDIDAKDKIISDYFEDELNEMQRKYDLDKSYDEQPAGQVGYGLAEIKELSPRGIIRALAISFEGGANRAPRNKNMIDLFKRILNIEREKSVLLSGFDITSFILLEFSITDGDLSNYYIEEEYLEHLFKQAQSFESVGPHNLNYFLILRILMQLDIKIKRKRSDIVFDRILNFGGIRYLTTTDVDRGGHAYRQINSYLPLLKPHGKLLCNVSDGFLITRNCRDIRKKIIEEKLVEAVITLSTETMNLGSIYTRASSSLLLLSHGNESVRFIDAISICTKGERYDYLQEEHVSKIISLLNSDSDDKYDKLLAIRSTDELLNSYYDYSLSSKLYTIEASNAECDVAKIADVAEVFRGLPLSKESLDERSSSTKNDGENDNKAVYITQASIDDDHLMNESVMVIDTSDINDEHIYLQENDIIMSKNGSSMKSSLIIRSLLPSKYRDMKIIPSENLYVIRPKDHYGEFDFSKLDIAIVIFCHINSNNGLEELKKLSNTSNLTTISKKNLLEMTLSLKYHKIEDLRKEFPEYLRLLAAAKKGYEHRKNNIDKLFNIDWEQDN